MTYFARITACCLSFLIVSGSIYSQPLVEYKWTVSSKKIGDGKFEIVFSTNGVQGWQLYSSIQTVPDLTTTELTFTDSAIVSKGGFIEKGTAKEISSPVFDNAKVKLYDGPVEWKTVVNIPGVVPAELEGTFQYTYGRGQEFYPTPYQFHVALEGGVSSTERIKISSIDVNNPESNCGDDIDKQKSMWGIFVLGLLGGFIALLTPCVFPMIPLTVSFFTK